METKTKKTRANAGETLVEVMASVFIFLIMMGIMEAAISYSNASLAKNKEIRANKALFWNSWPRLLWKMEIRRTLRSGRLTRMSPSWEMSFLQ